MSACREQYGISRRCSVVLAVLAWCMALLSPSLARAEAPRRIVSFNLCADQLVLALADPEQIAGLSPYAADPGLSVMANEAKKFPRLDWQAESIIPLHPDLVMIGSWDRAATRHLLAALGYRLAEIDVVLDVAAARAQITQVAALVGHPERGVALVQALDAAQRRLAEHPRPPLSTALVVERGGFSAGPTTLIAAVLADAGLRPPVGAPPGLGGFVPLERLLTLKPDVIVLKDAPSAATDQGALYLTHPALRAAYPPNRQIRLPTRYALCGGPALVAALHYLEGQLEKLQH